MRILTAQEFIKEPYGTVYIHYKSDMFIGQPKIKSEPRGKEFGESWWATDILPWFENEDRFDVKENPTEEFCTDDAIYNNDEDTLYAVFNKEEVKSMINRLVTFL